jgi:hypothetical protein
MCVRMQLEGGAIAWYPVSDITDDAVLVWCAPADGAWACYLEALTGTPRRYTGLDQALAELAATEALAAAGWSVEAP